MNPSRELVRAVIAVLLRPALWGTAIIECRRLAPDAWWRTRPFLPVPDADMLAFRATTQYGSPDHSPEADDLLAWLRWCKAENRRQRVR